MQAAENQKEEHHQDDRVKQLQITMQQSQKTSKK
jgi:hypothetical protein